MKRTNDRPTLSLRWSEIGSLRSDAYRELYQHPPLPMPERTVCSYVVFLASEKGEHINRDRLEELISFAGLKTLEQNDLFFLGTNDKLKVKWERHSEFETFTFCSRASEKSEFARTSIEGLPKQWTANHFEDSLVATHIHVTPVDKNYLEKPSSPDCFQSPPVAGGFVCDRNAVIWSDFRIQGDGFTRIVVKDGNLGPFRLGRLIQRILDIETYRVLAQMGQLTNYATNRRIAALEDELSNILAHEEGHSGRPDDKALLEKLIALSSRVDNLVTRDSNRYDATKAYGQIVFRRLEEINEQRIQGAQRLSNFIRRRFIPAMNTNDATATRLDKLEQRIARTSALFRTKIDVQVQNQNALVLDSMNRRADTQIKLQQTVEALSVVAISYYAIGIFSTLAKFLNLAGVSLQADLMTGIAAPIIVYMVFIFGRKLKRKLGLR